MIRRFVRLLYLTGSLRGSVAVCIAIVMALNPSQMPAAQPTMGFNTSFGFGPIFATLDITPPVVYAPAGATPVYSTTIHIHAVDNTKQPPFVGDLVAIGQAPDPNALVGGILPAVIIIMQDLATGSTFQDAVSHADTETGVRVSVFEDASLAEYGLLLALIAVVCIAALTSVQPKVSGQACAIQSSLVTGLKTIDLSPIGGSQGLNLTPCNSGVIP